MSSLQIADIHSNLQAKLVYHDRPETVLTSMIPAPSSCGAPPPGPVKVVHAPWLDLVASDGVRGQGADLDTRVLALELGKRHPRRKHTTRLRLRALKPKVSPRCIKSGTWNHFFVVL